MHPVRTQARGLIVHESQIALVRVRSNRLERWVLPGGGQDAGEALAHTVRRECFEELGLRVQVGPLCLVREFVPANHERARAPVDVQCIDFVVRCSVLGNTRIDPAASQPDSSAVEARWLSVADALALPLYPECLQECLPALLQGQQVHYVGDRL